MVLAGEEKIEEYAKPRTKGRGVSYGKIGLTTVAVTHDLLSGMPLVLLRKELIRLWNSILPEPGQPSAQLSKLIRLTTCKKTNHTVSRWYRTVHIPLLVASYDTHKGKRWLNSKPPSHRGEMLYRHGEDREVLMLLAKIECIHRRACKLLTDYNQKILTFHSIYDYFSLLKAFNTNTHNFH